MEESEAGKQLRVLSDAVATALAHASALEVVIYSLVGQMVRRHDWNADDVAALFDGARESLADQKSPDFIHDHRFAIVERIQKTVHQAVSSAPE